MEKPTRSELFISVLQSHKGILYKIARAYCRNTNDREDLVQEIIIQLWKAFDKYNPVYKYSTWIYRIALNVAISFYRKENTRQKMSGSLNENMIVFAEEEEKETDFGILQQMIKELNDLDKALMLLYLEEKSHREIAQIIGISESNVSTKINRIKNNFKQKFTQLKNN